MRAEQVDQALVLKFVTENERLVFWHDGPGEFADYVKNGLSGELADVQLVNLAEVGGLRTKLLLERDDPIGRYLVYSFGERPPAKDDWLFDIRLYSAQFHADIASIWLQELGLTQLSLREHLKARSAFLSSQDRRKKLAKCVSPKDDPQTLDLKMIAVLAGATVATPLAVVQAVYHSHTNAHSYDLSVEPEIIKTLEKMDLLDSFWAVVDDQFEYRSPNPSAAGLLRCLFLSEFGYQLGLDLASIAQFRLSSTGTRNAVVFLTQWRDSSTAAGSHDAAAAAVWKENNLKDVMGNLELAALLKVFTFLEVEKCVVAALKMQLLEETPPDAVAISAVASLRKAGHWLSGPGKDQPDRHALSQAYDAVVAAAELFALDSEHRHRLTFERPQDLLLAYRSELYKFDQAYRRFCLRVEPTRARGWDLLKSLADQVEKVYDHGFLQPLGIEWSRLLDAGFLNRWQLKELPPQQSFYKDVVKAHLDESNRKRAFVIISDAFRYEAAQELLAELNGRDGMTAELSTMLGVLPSYTKLGMASLLPHKKLAYNDKGEVLVDGQSSAGAPARSKILEAVQGMACQAGELRPMTTDQARDFTREQRVVYIYHNVIDSRGDSAATEGETFQAVSDCLREIADLIRFCFNKISASKVWVTADHGFIFQVSDPDLTDKSKLSHKPKQALTAKKRYVVGPKLGPSPEAHLGKLSITAGVEGDLEFWIARGTNRFHFTGGARYTHGGAMPQEVIIPVVTVTQLRGKHAEKAKVEQVSIQVLGTKHKITTSRYRFELLQLEPVSDRRKAATLRAAIYDGANPVSSIETVTFESQSENYEERKKPIKLELLSGTFDKTKPYHLVLRDALTEAEVQRVQLVIDRSFDDDF
jgi:uncharacterized protein (TIGR02687 family)